MRTAAKWLARYRGGDRELLDRSSRPHRSPGRLPLERVQVIERLRRLRLTAAEIAELLGLPLSVSLWLNRIGLGKRSRLNPLEPPKGYERRHPGELVHVDIKRLARIATGGAGHRLTGDRASQRRGWIGGRQRGVTGFEYLHVIVDDYSRLAYAEVLPTLNARDAAGFLRRAIAWYAVRGVTVRAVMSDNGSAYISDLYARTLHDLGLRHLRIKPRRPAHKRESRTPDPDTTQRMGVWPHLRQLPRTLARAPALPQPIQLPATTRQPPATSHRPHG